MQFQKESRSGQAALDRAVAGNSNIVLKLKTIFPICFSRVLKILKILNSLLRFVFGRLD